MSDFKIEVLTNRDGDEQLYQFSHASVHPDEEVCEWLGFKWVWVLNRARRQAPAPRIQLFQVTSGGDTRLVMIEDSDNSVSLSLAS